MLCLSCQKILKTPRLTIDNDHSKTFLHSKHLVTVRWTALGGCQICGMLCRHFDATAENHPAAHLQLSYNIYRLPNFIHFTYLGYNAKGIYKIVDIVEEDVWKNYVFKDNKVPNESQKSSITSTSSEMSLKQAQAWLNECLHSHNRCNMRLNEEWWPSRLIEIADSSNDFDIRLIETSESQASGPYLTLSHCWGTAEFLRLTTHNLEELKVGFALSVLPKTFRDAITVTKRLGYKYCWIDSLCIIQNSVDDWRREATVMSEVYQHSICNLAATHASDSSQGLFTDGPEPLPCIIKGYRLKPPDLEESVQPEINEPAPETLHLQDIDLWVHSVENAPLLKRGWVVQERLLARRMLHFSKGQLFWECREKRACEIYPEQIPERLIAEVSPTDLTRQYDTRIMKEWAWGTILQWYSNALLTKPEDKEVAIIGVINMLEKALDDTCVAGLWASSLFAQLLWHTGFRSPGIRQARRGPSWSWLSIDGKVSTDVREDFNGNDESELYPVDLIDLSVRRTARSSISPIIASYIQMRGTLHYFTWKTIYEPTGAAKMDIGGLFCPDFMLDCILVFPHPVGSYYCVIIALTIDWTNHSCLGGRGLILKLVAEGVYERMGYFQCNGYKATELISKRRRDMFKKDARTRTEQYEYFPFEVKYSADRCETKLTRQASTRELQEREVDTEEVVFTIL